MGAGRTRTIFFGGGAGGRCVASVNPWTEAMGVGRTRTIFFWPGAPPQSGPGDAWPSEEERRAVASEEPASPHASIDPTDPSNNVGSNMQLTH